RNIFNTVKVPKVGSSNFDLSYDHKTTLDMGYLFPVHIQEILPGDKMSIKTETLLRFAPLIAPVMHRINVYHHFFFVPNRILWPNWEDFIAQSGKDHVIPAFPTGPDYLTAYGPGTLHDYMGLPTIMGTPPAQINLKDVSALPYAAYSAIYNEYYRD